MFGRHVTEEALTDPKYAHDPRVKLLRNPCSKCGAARGHYCRTEGGGYPTLHKTRGTR